MSGTEPVFQHPASPDRVGPGGTGLPAIQRLVQCCQDTLGALGAGFVEFSPAGGRVIATSATSVWAVGRHVDPFVPFAAEVMRGDGPVEARSVDQTPETAG